MSELENIPGTGQDGRVSKKDIIQYIESRKNTSTKTTDNRQEQNQKPVVLQNNNNQQPEQNTQLQKLDKAVAEEKLNSKISQ